MELEGIKMICPSARLLGQGFLQGFRLRFTNADPNKRGLCSIEPSCFKDLVQGVVYEINHWELPEVYSNSRTSLLDVLMEDGSFLKVNVYYAKDNHLVAPEEGYLMKVHQNYVKNGFNMKALEDALDKTTY